MRNLFEVETLSPTIVLLIYLIFLEDTVLAEPPSCGTDEVELLGIYMYKVVISVCLFVCPIINQEPLDRFASNFDWGTRESHENVRG